jgi:hypothetical protein
MAWMVLARVVRWRDAEAETPQPNHDVDEPHEPGTAPIAIVTSHRHPHECQPRGLFLGHHLIYTKRAIHKPI